MNKGYKSIDEVNKALDSISKGREVREPNTQPEGSTWREGQRIYDTVCVKPTGRTPAEEEHCRQVQKKQLMQSNATVKKLKLGESLVVARSESTEIEEEVFIVLEGKKIFVESASQKNLEKIDITELCPHEFKSELADNKDIQKDGFDQAFILDCKGDVLPGYRGSRPSMHDPGSPDEPPEVDLHHAELIIDKDGSGLSRDFKVDLSNVIHKHKKFKNWIDDKFIDSVADAGDYEPPDDDRDR
jgi:hypothetical protein